MVLEGVIPLTHGLLTETSKHVYINYVIPEHKELLIKAFPQQHPEAPKLLLSNSCCYNATKY